MQQTQKLVINSQGKLVILRDTKRINVKRVYPVTGILGTDILNKCIKKVKNNFNLYSLKKELISNNVVNINYKFIFY